MSTREKSQEGSGNKKRFEQRPTWGWEANPKCPCDPDGKFNQPGFCLGHRDDCPYN